MTRAPAFAMAILAMVWGCATFDTPEEAAVASLWKQAREHQQYDRCPSMPGALPCGDPPAYVFVDDPDATCAASGITHRLVVDIAGDLRKSNRSAACTLSAPIRVVILPWSPGKLLVQHELAHDRYGRWHG